MLTINKIPTFIRQITGDIRLMRPSIRAVPVDSRSDPETAEVLAGLVRYVENRSDARHAYGAGADSQVAAGIGHWRVLTEYATIAPSIKKFGLRRSMMAFPSSGTRMRFFRTRKMQTSVSSRWI